MAPPRVFVSYAWEEEEYRVWVRALAERLRGDGVDVRLDAWHLEAGDTVPQFMAREFRHAQRVLVMCSPELRRKVHLAEDGTSTNGVGFEANLLASQVFANVPGARVKGLLALARGAWKDAAPDFLIGHDYVDLTSSAHFEAAYASLLDRILGRKLEAPPVGPAPAPRATPQRPALGFAPFGSADETIETSEFVLTFRIAEGKVFCSAPGRPEIEERFELALGPGRQLTRDVEAIQSNRCSPDDILNVGSELWLALQPGRIEALVEGVFAAARPQAGAVVEIRLDLPRELEGLPWEAIYALSEDACLGVAPQFCVSRLGAGKPRLRATRDAGVRLLAIVPGGSGLQSSVEWQKIHATLSLTPGVELTLLDGLVTPQVLAEKLRAPWDIVHFIGHGRHDERDSQRFKLRLNAPGEGGSEEEAWMAASTFVQTFHRAQTQIVVLNCCESAGTEGPGSSMGASFSKLGVPATIVMRYEIRDDAAAEFSRAFYRELLSGPTTGDVGLAVQEGRAALHRSFPDPQRVRSHITPVLYLGEGCRRLLPAMRTVSASRSPAAETSDATLPLPTKLRSAMANGRCLPIIGPGILSADAVRRQLPPPDPHTLGGNIARRGNFPDVDALHGLADTSAAWLVPLLFQRYCQHFESVDQTERSGLVEAIRNAYSGQQAPAAARRIASWKVPGFVYTHMDGLLEAELAQRQGRNLRVLQPQDLVKAPKLVPGSVSLLNLRGQLNSSESMILTEFDEDYLLDAVPEIASYIADLMNQNVGTSLVFLGVSARDPIVRALARRLLKQETRSRGTAYFVARGAGAADRAYWERFDRLEWLEDIDLDTVIRALTAASAPSVEGRS